MIKNLKTSLIILIITIIIFIWNNRNQSNLETFYEPIFKYNSENITKFLIKEGNESIEIVKNDTIWEISNNDSLVIKSRSIESLFDKVLKLNKSTIISENPDKYIKYSVDDSSGIHLKIFNNKDENLGNYIFGRSKSDYSRSYIRIGNDPKVYLADQNVIYMLQTKPTYWGEKPKLDIPTQSIATDSLMIPQSTD